MVLCDDGYLHLPRCSGQLFDATLIRSFSHTHTQSANQPAVCTFSMNPGQTTPPVTIGLVQAPASPTVSLGKRPPHPRPWLCPKQNKRAQWKTRRSRACTTKTQRADARALDHDGIRRSCAWWPGWGCPDLGKCGALIRGFTAPQSRHPSGDITLLGPRDAAPFLPPAIRSRHPLAPGAPPDSHTL